MAKTPDVVAGQKIASTWGNEIRDRTRQLFANGTDLTTNWPNAPDGSMAVTTDVGATWIKLKGVWRDAGALTWAYNAVVTTDQFGNGSLALPAGTSSVRALTANGTQRQFPKFVVWDTSQSNNLSAVLWFYNADGAAAISQTVGVTVVAVLWF